MINVKFLENFFVIFQLPVAYGVDDTALEDRFWACNVAHPDRHVEASDELYEGRPDVGPLTIFVSAGRRAGKM